MQKSATRQYTLSMTGCYLIYEKQRIALPILEHFNISPSQLKNFDYNLLIVFNAYIKYIKNTRDCLNIRLEWGFCGGKDQGNVAEMNKITYRIRKTGEKTV